MRLSAFSINTIFVVMMILGISLVPRLSLQLEPSSRSNKLNVSFSWTNANPELLETEVTTKLEGAFARIRGLNEIHSTTGNGYGAIELTIDPKENIDAVKLYLSSIIRSVAPGLPEDVRVSGVSGGEIHDGRVNRTPPVDDIRVDWSGQLERSGEFRGRPDRPGYFHHAGSRKHERNRDRPVRVGDAIRPGTICRHRSLGKRYIQRRFGILFPERRWKNSHGNRPRKEILVPRV